ncbi:MAG TPA: hypothetical protein VF865_16305 [Acidobacteriaceae bacterium]
MLQKTRSIAIALALLAAFATVAPTPAHAWPLGKLLHLHPSATRTEDSRITVRLLNRTDTMQEIRIGEVDRVVGPHEGLIIKAPEGTQVVAAASNYKHRRGDVLFAVSPEMNGQLLTLD